MSRPIPHTRSPQSGIVLVSSLLLLLVVTIIAISMFHSFGLQEKIAGNVREKQRALQVAASAQEYAEWWLTTSSKATFDIENGYPSADDKNCDNSALFVATGTGAVNGGEICANTLPSISSNAVSVTAWPTATTYQNMGVQYQPPNMNFTNSAALDYYPAAQAPRFYIADLGPLATARGEVYQIDAYGYGLSTTGVAVVESTMSITCVVCNLGGL
jgi:type IV pilus assembly protein PilX